ncbi:MAG: pantetheine-phosphate adenylyltransferase [Gammaproteobacteria bacterium]|nr:pantetheine-phosphate adenylyltransferase [Gammaproteobacteria bacterium]MBU1926204.1 pantetheine-phosphate adenylyltransferase [Gammaproteobacteria bacterium]MBU2545562.1 pantetheine-phosphate adenylyltransferase [Gammaproteobacteria bacterium]
MKNKIIYAGTFDPITYGHVDLIKRALEIFDTVVVGIADNPRKAPLFSLQEREQLVRGVFAEDNRVAVKGFSGLLADFAKEQETNIILRGLRVVSDFDYEFQMASVNRFLGEIETVFLTPSENYTFVSSSLIKEIAIAGGDVSSFVPKLVQAALQRKL